ncbi:hypothetical protein KC347_g302 [Hortaea werneckii]|nr:hypothetical protein KC347_g302 [Hortaea werneckii]
MTGIRALLLSIPCLAIFIVRVMNMEVGGRTTTSGIETFVQRATEARTWMTLFWYCFGGWFFGEVYIWSSSEDAELGWIDYGRAYERPRANENPVMLRCMILLFSLAKALQHLSSDRDDVKIREAEMIRDAGEEYGRQRDIVDFAYPLACIMVRSLPSNADPSGILFASVFARQAVSSCGLLVMLWELSNVIFTIHVSQLPLKRGEPLTNEVKDPAGKVLSKSADPNGSLIRGFKAKATVTRGFAFWELFLITTQFETRRTTIFSEVERKPQSTWAQTSALCLAELNAIGERIKNANAPSEYQKKTAESEQQRKQQEYLIAQEREKNLSLPKIAQRGVLDEREVFAKHTGNPVSTAIKSFGQSPVVPNFPVQAVIYGVPFGSKANIFHAAKSLVSLAVSSLKEDDFGQVAPSVPLIIRTFTSTITAVQKHKHSRSYRAGGPTKEGFGRGFACFWGSFDFLSHDDPPTKIGARQWTVSLIVRHFECSTINVSYDLKFNTLRKDSHQPTKAGAISRSPEISWIITVDFDRRLSGVAEMSVHQVCFSVEGGVDGDSGIRPDDDFATSLGASSMKMPSTCMSALSNLAQSDQVEMSPRTSDSDRLPQPCNFSDVVGVWHCTAGTVVGVDDDLESDGWIVCNCIMKRFPCLWRWIDVERYCHSRWGCKKRCVEQGVISRLHGMTRVRLRFWDAMQCVVDVNSFAKACDEYRTLYEVHYIMLRRAGGLSLLWLFQAFQYRHARRAMLTENPEPNNLPLHIRANF